MLCGDIESNPGPRPNSSQSFSICHWNLNSITAHNFSKISLLRAYNAIHNYVSQKPILTTTHYPTVTILRYQVMNYLGFYHPSNQKRGGVSIYHKDFLPIKVNNISCLKECLNFSLSVYGKQRNITLIYRSPSQSSEEFDKFLSNFEFSLDYVAIVTRL